MMGYWWVLPLVFLVVGYKFVLRIFGVVIIPEDSIGIVNKKFVLSGKNRTLPDGSIIALQGEAGYQADALAPGLHFWYWPWQYEITRQKFVTIPDGSIGVVRSRDGRPLPQGRVLAKRVECDSFQDARKFLTGGGERGPQITVVPPGTYRINTALFTIENEEVLEIADGMVGIVTTKEGKPLDKGEIAGVDIKGHNTFQDAQAFIDNGGSKGLQEQVMLAGRYFLNPEFARVETVEMTKVPIAHVGVVIAYVGDEGKDVTGEGFKHGNLVTKGQKGVWATALDPGKYPVNPHTHKVELVPTANVVLNWANEKSEAHKLDEKLCTITVRSSDGFTFNLDVAQIIHIPSTDAPKVIARFGSVANLVTQVLEPTIGNYFRNAAQGSDAIEFLKGRKERQNDAKASIKAALEDYDVGAVDTLIGDIVPPEALMKTLTDRKIAAEQKTTYENQRDAQKARTEFEREKSLADTQEKVVSAERSIVIADSAAQAAVKTAEGEAAAKTAVATADAMVLRTVGAATAEKTKLVGTAEADVIRMKTEAMDQEKYAMVEVARALAGSGFKLVPDIVAGGDAGGSGGGSIVNILLAQLVAASATKTTDKKASAPSAEVKIEELPVPPTRTETQLEVPAPPIKK